MIHNKWMVFIFYYFLNRFHGTLYLVSDPTVIFDSKDFSIMVVCYFSKQQTYQHPSLSDTQIPFFFQQCTSLYLPMSPKQTKHLWHADIAQDCTAELKSLFFTLFWSPNFLITKTKFILTQLNSLKYTNSNLHISIK